MSAVCGGDAARLVALWREAARSHATRPWARTSETAVSKHGPRRGGALPGTTCRLAIRVHGLVDRSGLDAVRLEELTDVSRHTWERWLNGQQPLPKHAVLYLVAACSEETSDLVALWEEVAKAPHLGQPQH